MIHPSTISNKVLIKKRHDISWLAHLHKVGSALSPIFYGVLAIMFSLAERRVLSQLNGLNKEREVVYIPTNHLDKM